MFLMSKKSKDDQNSFFLCNFLHSAEVRESYIHFRTDKEQLAKVLKTINRNSNNSPKFNGRITVDNFLHVIPHLGSTNSAPAIKYLIFRKRVTFYSNHAFCATVSNLRKSGLYIYIMVIGNAQAKTKH